MSPGQTALYFRGSDPDHGTELWRSDGTPDGTWRVTDVCPGRCDGLPGPVTVLAGQLFFTADDGVSGRELWRSDGTPGGERRVRDLCPGPCSLGVSGIATLGGRALFAASAGSRRRALWSTRGSRRSTAELKTVCTVPLGLDDCVRLGEGQRVGGWVFFQILIDSAGHSELWRTDGTAAGTGPLREVVTGGSFLNTGAIFPTGLDSERGFFWTADALWRTDGTPAGTVPVKTLRELLENPQGSSSPGPTAVWNGELYTFLSTGEVVRSDGTPAGTVRITTLGPSTRAAAVVPTPAHLFFLATDADGTPNQVWRTRGTAETTELILDTRPSFLGRSFAAAGDRLLFGVSETGLWSSDGTVSGTAPIGSDLQGHPGEVMVSLGGLAVFPKGSYPIFDELWSSDGTPAGTLPVRDFSALPGGAGPIRQTVLDNRLVYSGWADSVAPTLLSSDGNVSGHSRSSAARAPAPTCPPPPAPAWRWAASRSSPRTMGGMAASCGAATAPPTAPAWCATSTPGASPFRRTTPATFARASGCHPIRKGSCATATALCSPPTTAAPAASCGGRTAPPPALAG
jgi:ELWxxDGT repeat protein